MKLKKKKLKKKKELKKLKERSGLFLVISRHKAHIIILRIAIVFLGTKILSGAKIINFGPGPKFMNQLISLAIVI